MIKNIVMALLILAVLGLSWISLSQIQTKNQVAAKLLRRIEAAKKQIEVARETIKMKDGLSVSAGPAVEKERLKKEEQNAKTVIIKGQETAQSGEKMHEPPPSNILKDLKRKQKNKENLTDKDLESILSILKSAQNLLNKTSFNYQMSQEKIPAKNINPQPAIIKKKLYTGPEELG